MSDDVVTVGVLTTEHEVLVELLFLLSFFDATALAFPKRSDVVEYRLLPEHQKEYTVVMEKATNTNCIPVALAMLVLFELERDAKLDPFKTFVELT